MPRDWTGATAPLIIVAYTMAYTVYMCNIVMTNGNAHESGRETDENNGRIHSEGFGSSFNRGRDDARLGEREGRSSSCNWTLVLYDERRTRDGTSYALRVARNSSDKIITLQTHEVSMKSISELSCRHASTGLLPCRAHGSWRHWPVHMTLGPTKGLGAIWWHNGGGSSRSLEGSFLCLQRRLLRSESSPLIGKRLLLLAVYSRAMR